MSQLLKVAATVRGMTDSQLQSLIAMRMVNTAAMKDFFDLAEALSKPTSVASALASLPKPQIIALRDLANGSPAKKIDAEELHRLALVGPSPAFEIFESTLDALSMIDKKKLETKLISVISVEAEQDHIDRDCGVEIFETLQAITELIFDLEQRYVREVGKKTVGLPDLKRLANHLGKPIDFAREIYDLASMADLISLNNGRWQLNRNSDSWLAWSQLERANHLLKTWRLVLGDNSAKEIIKLAKENPQLHSLPAILNEMYPLADSSMNSKISKLATIAKLVGLTANGLVSSWMWPLLERDSKLATKLMASRLPQQQERIICQADLTIIAPGPLATDVEIMLRRFADTEQVGLASTYRLSALSVSHGLETGLKLEEIKSLLNKLSDKPLPQPMEYLLNEAGMRFGRLVVKTSEFGSEVWATDPILIAEILNEIKLKPFDFRAHSNGSLHTRFESDVIYFGLRELGFVAIRQDASGQVISPRTIVEINETSDLTSSALADIERLRQHESRVGDSPDDDDLQRQIQLAIKNKARARFTVSSAQGNLEFLLEPVGIANGRLRAKDRKADIERTLPLTSIIKVVLE